MFTESELIQIKEYCEWYHRLCVAFVHNGGRKPTEAEDERFLVFLNVVRGEGLLDGRADAEGQPVQPDPVRG